MSVAITDCLSSVNGLAHAFVGIPPESPGSFENDRAAKAYRVRHRQYALKQVMGEHDEKDAPPPTLICLNQTHSTIVHVVTQALVETHKAHDITGEDVLIGDGLVTRLKNVVLAVKTADCGPLLWSAPRNGLIGVTHAGWRGALDGVIEETWKQMEAQGASIDDVRVVLGPTIAQQNYEVGEDFYQFFLKQDAKNKTFFDRKDGQLFFSLPDFICARLKDLGIHYQNLALDTFSGFFYSRRRSLLEKKIYGSNYGLIGWTP